MVKGAFVRKNNRLIFAVDTDKSKEEAIEHFDTLRNMDEGDFFFIPIEDVDKSYSEIKGFHRISQDGSVEDARKIVGYQATLEDKIEAKGKQFTKDTKVFKVDDRKQAEELANKLNMEITDFEEIKKLPKT